MEFYKKVHIYVTAMMFNGQNTKEVAEFSEGRLQCVLRQNGQVCVVERDTMETVATVGQYIVRDGYNHYVGMSKEEFEGLYERV